MVAALLSGVASTAIAQSAPPWGPGALPTDLNWKAFWATKQDLITAIPVSILDSKADCNAFSANPTDDTAALNTWAATLPPGTIVTIPENAFCLINSANFTPPPAIKFQGVGGFPGDVNQGGNPIGGGFAVNPTYCVQPSNGDIFENVGIWRYLGDGHFHISPTQAQALSDVYQWSQEFSIGMCVPATTSGIVERNVFIEGFRICEAIYTSHVDIYGMKTDCGTSIAGFLSGDTNFWHDVRQEPFYSGTMLSLAGQRYDACFYLGFGGGYTMYNPQCEGWPMALVIEGAGNSLVDHLVAEYQERWNNSPVGFPAEQFGTFIHAIDLTGDELRISRASWGAAGSPGVLCDGVAVDADPDNITWQLLTIISIPQGCKAFRAGGNTAPAIVEQISSLPAPGTTISISVSGTAGAWQGGAAFGPYVVNYTVRPQDTLATVVQNIDFLFNTDWAAFAHFGITSTTNAGIFGPGNNLPGVFAITYPSDSTLSVSITGTPTTTLSGGIFLSGAFSIIDGLNLVSGNNQGGVWLGNSNSGAHATTIDNLVWSNGSSNLPSTVGTVTVVNPGSGCDSGGSGSGFNFFVPGGLPSASNLLNETLLTVNLTSGAISGTPTFYPGSYSTYPTGTVTLGSGNAVASATTSGGASGTGGTPGPVTLTVVGGTGTPATLTGTINAAGVLQSGLTVTGAGLYSVLPGTTAVAVTGGGLIGATVNLNFAGGANTTLCSVYPTVNLTWRALWLDWDVAPTQLTLTGIPWSRALTANLNGTGGAGALIGANSFDDHGEITVGAGSTGTLTFTTPFPGGVAPFCNVWNVPGSWLASNTQLAVTNLGQSVATVFNYRCSFDQVHS